MGAKREEGARRCRQRAEALGEVWKLLSGPGGPHSYRQGSGLLEKNPALVELNFWKSTPKFRD